MLRSDLASKSKAHVRSCLALVKECVDFGLCGCDAFLMISCYGFALSFAPFLILLVISFGRGLKARLDGPKSYLVGQLIGFGHDVGSIACLGCI